jgi:hypothetical protein
LTVGFWKRLHSGRCPLAQAHLKTWSPNFKSGEESAPGRSARRKCVQLGFVDLGLYVHQSQDRMKQMVMRNGLVCFAGDTAHLCVVPDLELRRQPSNHRHVQLLIWGQRIGHAMQVQTFFTQGLSTVVQSSRSHQGQSLHLTSASRKSA